MDDMPQEDKDKWFRELRNRFQAHLSQLGVDTSNHTLVRWLWHFFLAGADTQIEMLSEHMARKIQEGR